MTKQLLACLWLRETDSNRHSPGYEPNMLPLHHPAALNVTTNYQLNLTCLGAGEEIRTPNRLITNQMRCRCATPAKFKLRIYNAGRSCPDIPFSIARELALGFFWCIFPTLSVNFPLPVHNTIMTFPRWLHGPGSHTPSLLWTWPRSVD